MMIYSPSIVKIKYPQNRHVTLPALGEHCHISLAQGQQSYINVLHVGLV